MDDFRFELGQTVRLRSGGLPMTIEHRKKVETIPVAEANKPLEQRVRRIVERYTCIWQALDGTRQREDFPAHVLNAAGPDESGFARNDAANLLKLEQRIRMSGY